MDCVAVLTNSFTETTTSDSVMVCDTVRWNVLPSRSIDAECIRDCDTARMCPWIRATESDSVIVCDTVLAKPFCVATLSDSVRLWLAVLMCPWIRAITEECVRDCDTVLANVLNSLSMDEECVNVCVAVRDLPVTLATESDSVRL